MQNDKFLEKQEAQRLAVLKKIGIIKEPKISASI